MAGNRFEGNHGNGSQWANDSVREQLLSALERLNAKERQQLLELFTRTEQAAEFPTIQPDWAPEGNNVPGEAASGASNDSSTSGTTTGEGLLSAMIEPWVRKEQEAWEDGRRNEAMAIHADREQWAMSMLTQIQMNTFSALGEIARNLRG